MRGGLKLPLSMPFRGRRDPAPAHVAPREPGAGYPVTRRREAYAEFAGRSGVDATRYGDWEYGGRCTDF